jgi:zinc protease
MNVFSQETIHTEDTTGQVKVYTLANGFQLFVKEDLSSALVHVELAVRAGFTEQTPSSTGFFPLYTKLFLSTAQSNASETVRALASQLPVTALCNEGSATYTADCAPESVPSLLALLAACSIHPQFTDAQIKEQYGSLKDEALQNEGSTTGFINSAIDSRIFYEAPWRHDSGIYPALFTKYSTAEVRTQLAQIAKRYYTPDNSALFISGNITSADINALVEKYFSIWQGYAFHVPPSSENGISQKRRFVLSDPSFSKDFTQIVVQYTSLNQSQADILAASFTSASSPYKDAVLAQPALGVRSKEYLTAASSPFNNGGRLILQALLEAPYSFSKEKGSTPVSSAAQAALFLQAATAAANLPRTQFIAAQNLIASKYKSQSATSAGSMSLLADYWAFDTPSASNKSGADFYARFLNMVYAAQSETEQAVYDAVTKEEPFVFLLVNSAVYEKQKNDFTSAGYEQVTRANASWYSDELIKKNAFASETTNNALETDAENAAVKIENGIRAEDFYASNSSRFITGTLKNGIPIVLKQNPSSQTVLISIAISGGEAASPANERFLRTVLINAFANNIQKEINTLRQNNKFFGDTTLRSWTEESESYITIECIRDDVQTALLAAANAILYGEILPITADRLVMEQKNLWLTKSASLSYQMTCTALSTFFSGTQYEKLFDADSAILKDTTYNSISLSYTQLLNASAYMIVFSGDVSFTEVFTSAENTFGMLMKQSERTQQESHEPSVAKTTRKLRLRHTFTTDIAAENAGARPEVLVPTTDFSDPVQFWIQAPKESTKRALFNALLYELQSRVIKEYGGSLSCSLQIATPVIHAACIQGDRIAHTAQFLTAYKKAMRSLTEDISKDDGSLTKTIVSRWIRLSLSKTATNEGTAALIQQGLLDGNALQYLDDYRVVSNATKDIFSEILQTYFSEDPVYKLYSADSKR